MCRTVTRARDKVVSSSINVALHGFSDARAVVRGVIHSRDYPEDAIQTMMKQWHMDRDVSVDAYNLVREALIPVPTEKGVELMAHWQSIALNVPPKRPARDYMDLRFVKEVMAELEKK